MDKTIGFIGAGNMSQAMIGGIINSKLVDKKNIIASDKDKALIKKLENNLAIGVSLDNKEIARQADFLILGVKPDLYKMILEEIKDCLKENTIIISIAAGISLDFLKNNLNENTKIVKTMPNTPALVGQAMSAISPGDNLKQEEIEEVVKIFESFGQAEILDESLMDGFTALCGSSPAYIYMLIEAMADAGVKEGIPRKLAYKMAAQATLGSAKMVIETGDHPAKLKDDVCSPSGTTIDAVIALEKAGFRPAIMKAIGLCAKRSKEMNV